jgi:hypothetical protein
MTAAAPSPQAQAQPSPAAPAQGLPQDLLDELARDMVKGGKSVNWLAERIERELRASTAAAPSPVPAEVLRNDLETALGMLADWCVAVDMGGTQWDDWDEHYKDAMYRAGPLRALLDKAIAEARARRALWDRAAAPGAPTPAPKGTE